MKKQSRSTNTSRTPWSTCSWEWKLPTLRFPTRDLSCKLFPMRDLLTVFFEVYFFWQRVLWRIFSSCERSSGIHQALSSVIYFQFLRNWVEICIGLLVWNKAVVCEDVHPDKTCFSPGVEHKSQTAKALGGDLFTRHVYTNMYVLGRVWQNIIAVFSTDFETADCGRV